MFRRGSLWGAWGYGAVILVMVVLALVCLVLAAAIDKLAQLFDFAFCLFSLFFVGK